MSSFFLSHLSFSVQPKWWWWRWLFLPRYRVWYIGCETFYISTIISMIRTADHIIDGQSLFIWNYLFVYLWYAAVYIHRSSIYINNNIQYVSYRRWVAARVLLCYHPRPGKQCRNWFALSLIECSFFFVCVCPFLLLLLLLLLYYFLHSSFYFMYRGVYCVNITKIAHNIVYLYCLILVRYCTHPLCSSSLALSIMNIVREFYNMDNGSRPFCESAQAWLLFPFFPAWIQTKRGREGWRTASTCCWQEAISPSFKPPLTLFYITINNTWAFLFFFFFSLQV
jgi:hypothetical protein